ncbi:arylacetamide deacetylase-like [Mytilus californianus]|uniref:arylacetamide deacetylase-like n=1 Tax=Mytilus californianus TaxID=6549 RepID=UPI002246C7A9|nr:arylacetamide deacetylase-like [Mytilus californianus]
MIGWITAVISFLLLYYLYIPIPREATEPWKLYFTSIVMKIQGDLVVICALLTKKKIHDVMRKSFHRLISFFVYFQPKIQGIEEEEANFDGILVRIFKPTSTNGLVPGIVYIHGGGWYIFNTKTYSYFTKLLSKKVNAVVVSIEYRLAPENTFPVPFEDCLNATKYFLTNARKYNVNPDKVGIAGDSAGGNLTMAVALKLAIEPTLDIPKLAYQVLIYPCLQALDFNLPSFRENNIDRNTHCGLTRNAMILFNNLYAFGNYDNFMAFSNNTHVTVAMKKKYRSRVDPKCLQGRYQMEPNDDTETDNTDLANQISEIIFNPYFAPLMATDAQLGKLPNTFLITCEYDGLRDEGLILNERMKAINHSIKHLHLPGSEHGVLIYPYYKVYKSSVDRIACYIQEITK